jgi:MFS-type transporter involved in bile tolerance (Atg22 family)
MLEDRIGLERSKTQSVTFALLAESALVGVVSSPMVGHICDSTSHKKSLLMYCLGFAMVGSVGLALSGSGM